jgi:hypothetical protein
MDSPWEEDPQADYAPKADWAKLSNEFTNVRAPMFIRRSFD